MLKLILSLSQLSERRKMSMLNATDFKSKIREALPVYFIGQGKVHNFGTDDTANWGMMTFSMVRHPFQRYTELRWVLDLSLIHI